MHMQVRGKEGEYGETQSIRLEWDDAWKGKAGYKIRKLKRGQITEGFVCHTRESGPNSTVSRGL